MDGINKRQKFYDVNDKQVCVVNVFVGIRQHNRDKIRTRKTEEPRSRSLCMELALAIAVEPAECHCGGIKPFQNTRTGTIHVI